MIQPKLAALLCFMTPLLLNAQIPSGAIGRYTLDANANDISGSGYNGTLTSTTATTNRLGTANSARAFTAGSSFGTLPVALVTAMQNDFSIGYWFKTNMTAGSSTQWYGGNAMVDAEVCGGVNDWGTALIDGGKVCFGVGNTDITIKSTLATYNDNAWHFVTATRNKAGGTIILYVDGVSVASSGSINPGSLNAPTSIGLGNNPCNSSPVYTGSLDDIIVYNRVLSGAEVSNLYTALGALALPVTWLSFTGAITENTITLKWLIESSATNDHFEIEHAADGVHFTVQGIVRSEDAISTAAAQSLYAFTSAAPAGNTHYYRLKQTDKDGAYAYSKTIVLNGQNTKTAFTLQTNPVINQLVLVNNQQALVQRLQVIDMTGRVISDKLINTSNTIISSSTQILQKGYYLLKVITANGSHSLALVKQ